MVKPILKPVEEQDANETVRQAYSKIKAKYGFVPPNYKIMANDPAYLASLIDHAGRVLAPRKIDAKTKEVIALVVATLNQCDYCTNAHTMGLRQMGLDDEAIAEILGTVAFWSEMNRFHIGARITWPEQMPAANHRPEAAHDAG